ncbi:helix-turn-helix transcriptional regulator [Hymenobacter sp. BT507]|uniref:Helix-turn-helix transcriptional regulator n=1 Tax=Hymenobacter citatus TaxID=2763506 RepID=A0ABR7MMR9_9BACT|nr:helix-turn-helix transcriptional regulator [Hymenobacter citatus]MBC6612380.1 helix-turn-helix transcriptional regulator [Hymenobacter citatus]
MPAPSIHTYAPRDYLRQFAAGAAAVPQLLTAAAEQFFIVPVERLYPLFTQALPPTRATAHTCLLLTSGTATMHIGPERCTIGPGELLLVRAGQVYAFEPGDQNTGLLCHFHDDLLIGPAGRADALAAFSLLHFWGGPVVRLDAGTAGFVENLLRRLLVEYEAHALEHPRLVRAYLLALLEELHQAAVTDLPVAQDTAGTLANRFKQLVATSLSSLHLVSDYAERLHVTPNYLTKAVRTATGKPPARWIEESIVLEAKVLLGHSTWPISDIAQRVGLSDPSYFSRLFKKHAGLSPLAYRKKVEKS